VCGAACVLVRVVGRGCRHCGSRRSPVTAIATVAPGRAAAPPTPHTHTHTHTRTHTHARLCAGVAAAGRSRRAPRSTRTSRLCCPRSSVSTGSPLWTRRAACCTSSQTCRWVLLCATVCVFVCVCVCVCVQFGVRCEEHAPADARVDSLPAQHTSRLLPERAHDATQHAHTRWWRAARPSCA
jgi:hypothetical protein